MSSMWTPHAANPEWKCFDPQISWDLGDGNLWLTYLLRFDRDSAAAVDKAIDGDMRWSQLGAQTIQTLVADGQEERPGKVCAQVFGTQETVTALAARQDVGIEFLSSGCADDWTTDSKKKAVSPVEHEATGRVVVVVIDDGIAVANRRFRASDTSTRVLAFYNMDDRGGDDESGRTWTKAEIDALLVECQDEEEIYKRMGMWVGLNPTSKRARRASLARRVGHGTHVLDLAAGAEPGEGLSIDILAVQLPYDVVDDWSGSKMPQALKNAVEWIQKQLISLDYPPVVVNCSFGVHAGRKDGHEPVEQFLQTVIAGYGDDRKDDIAVVMSAGNSLQSRAVAEIGLAPGEARTLDWVVQPDDRSDSFLQIWADHQQDVAQTLSVQLVPPRDKPADSQPSLIGHYTAWIWQRHAAARMYHQQIEQRERVTLALRPTGNSEPGIFAPHGTWKIIIKNLGRKDCAVNAMIQRDDGRRGEAERGRQSYFSDPGYRRFEEPSGAVVNHLDADHSGYVKRRGTQSAYATGTDFIVVAGVRGSDGVPARYSSAGPSRNEARRFDPDVAAVSEDSPAHPGVLASGIRSNTVGLLSGTSVAAPQVARLLAHAFSEGRSYEEAISDGVSKIAENAEAQASRVGRGTLASARVPKHRQRVAGQRSEE